VPNSFLINVESIQIAGKTNRLYTLIEKNVLIRQNLSFSKQSQIQKVEYSDNMSQKLHHHQYSSINQECFGGSSRQFIYP